MTSILETAKQIRAFENVLGDARETQMYSDKWGKLVDGQNTLLEQHGAAIASAYIDALERLEEAEAHIQVMLDIFEPIPGSETSLDDKRMIREARAFLSRISKEQDNG